MTLPSGAVNIRRIIYSNYAVAPANIYEDAIYGSRLDQVLIDKPTAVVQGYRYTGGKQTAISVPTGTPTYWWFAGAGVVAKNNPPQDNDTVYSWANQGVSTSGTLTPDDLAKVIYKVDRHIGLPWIQKQHAGTNLTLKLSLPQEELLGNYTAHLVVRVDATTYGTLMGTGSSNSYPLLAYNVTGTLYATNDNAGEMLRGVWAVPATHRWGVFSVAYNVGTKTPVYWFNGGVLLPLTGTIGAATYTASGVFNFKDFVLWSTNNGASVAEIIVDKVTQTTGVVLSWQNYLLSKYYY